jgi:hypothetical protein
MLLKAPPASDGPTLTCNLLGKQAPRGGKIDLEGKGFGATPVIRIGGKVVRVLQRGSNQISAQVPDDSDSGAVTITDSGSTAYCGSLEIIGKDR